MRPYPGWLRSLRLSDGPGPRDRNRAARRLWALSTIAMTSALVLLLALVNANRATTMGDERVRDDEFLAAADRACARADRDVVRPYVDSGASNPERLADGMERLVLELREFAVAGRDAGRVGAWLDAWDEWVAAGHAYADAVDADDDAKAAKISADSQSAKIAINRFALANGLASCVL